jgi:acyl dehydratase
MPSMSTSGAHSVAVDALRVGMELGPSGWREVTQAEIDAFAAATGDRQWIHVDTDRAAGGPFGTTVAHGMLTLSLAVAELDELLQVEDAALVVNYGFDRVRFPAPVPAGSRIRVRGGIASVEAVDGGAQAVLGLTVDLEGSPKPCCAAELVLRFLR